MRPAASSKLTPSTARTVPKTLTRSTGADGWCGSLANSSFGELYSSLSSRVCQGVRPHGSGRSGRLAGRLGAMTRFRLRPGVTGRFPGVVGGVIHATDVRNPPAAPDLAAAFEAEQLAVRERLGTTPLVRAAHAGGLAQRLPRLRGRPHAVPLGRGGAPATAHQAGRSAGHQHARGPRQPGQHPPRAAGRGLRPARRRPARITVRFARGDRAVGGPGRQRDRPSRARRGHLRGRRRGGLRSSLVLAAVEGQRRPRRQHRESSSRWRVTTPQRRRM